MTKTAQKLVLSASRDIPFDKLVLSQGNVRRVKAGVSIAELAEDIARRTLLHGLTVRPLLDEAGVETGLFEVPVGGRRFRALELLVKMRRFPKDGVVPCIVKDAHDPITPEEDSLAENTWREPLHPLDEFRGMQKLVDQGQAEEAIAVHFNTTATVVKQRLRLASVSPRLHKVYGEDGMTLEQLIAFSVNEDHVRQEAVWELLGHSWNKSPAFIRQKLTEDAVHAGDRRVRFVGVEAYLAAGGQVMRDLFEDDHGGWLSDPALLDRLVADKLKLEGERVKTEGWAWVVTSVALPYGFDDGLRELDATPAPLSAEAETKIAALTAEQEALELEHDGAEDLPDPVQARLDEIDQALTALTERRWTYDPAEMARAGAFVSFRADGVLQVDRGFVRPDDELPETPDEALEAAPEGEGAIPATAAVVSISANPPDESEAEPDALKPLPDRLVTELTVQRTLALQNAVAQNPKVAFTAVLHALALAVFYPSVQETCLGLLITGGAFTHQPPDLRNSAAAKAIEARQVSWKARLPKSDKDLWVALRALDADDQMALFAHCAAFAVNAVWEAVSRFDGRVSAQAVQRRVAHADVLATAVDLDMAAEGWRPTFANYFGRATKAHILTAVLEAKGADAVRLIDHLRKDDMARQAERLLSDANWLPEPLRTTNAQAIEPDQAEEDDDGAYTPRAGDRRGGASVDAHPAA
ncbi:MAG: ParB/RepB/Spo0J family partition protein [Pseudomonadota bacterium]|jgi:ParB family chromosome partitioning protein